MWNTIRKRLDSPDAVLSLVLGFAVILVVGLTVVNAVRSFLQRPTADQKKTEVAAQAGLPVALPTSHTVKEDESLWTISEYYYKSGYNWVDINAANSLPDENYIVPDQKLVIPDAKPRIVEGVGDVTPVAASTVKPKHTSYTVMEGDNLWDISIKEYDSGYKWPDVASANSIPNPDLIYPGTILQLQ